MRLNLKVARLKCGKKQKDVAAEVGIAQTYLSALENGQANNPSKSVMDKLAAALNSSVHELFYSGIEDNAQPEPCAEKEQGPDMQDTGRRKKTDMEIAEEVITKYFRGGFAHQEGEK